jgi:hypothetical protein
MLSYSRSISIFGLRRLPHALFILYCASSLSAADEAIVIVDLRLGKKFLPFGRRFSDCLSGRVDTAGALPAALVRPIGRWLTERVAALKLGGT